MRKTLYSSWPITSRSMVGYRPMSEEVILGLKPPRVKRHGLNRKCPCCDTWNFISFSRKWVECQSCKVAYGL